MPRKHVNLAIALVCFALCLPRAWGQTPDASDILRKVGEIYSASQEYEVNAVVTTVDAHLSEHLFVRLPKKYRRETRGEVVDNRGPQLTDEVVTVVDGSTLWAWYPKLHEYESTDRIPNDVNTQSVDLFPGVGLFRDTVKSFRKDHNLTIRLMPEERLTTPGGTADCFVVELTNSLDWTLLWIDKRRYYVLKLQTKKPDGTPDTTIVYDTIKLHPSVPDTVFQFHPPPDAQHKVTPP